MSGDTKKMLRTIINGQSALKGELLKEIKKVQSDLSDHRKETKIGFKEVNKRVDKIGKTVAYLEDDLPAIAALKRWQAGAPTREEYDKLEERVGKVEHRIASI